MSDAKRDLRAILAPLRPARRLGGDSRSELASGAATQEVAADLPFFVVGHPTLGALPADDSEAWVLG